MLERFFGKKETARSHQTERAMLTSLANIVVDRLEKRKGELGAGSITSSKLVHEILSSVDSNISDLETQPLLQETRTKLIERLNVDLESSDRALVTAYLRSKLLPIVESAKQKPHVESEQLESIDQKLDFADSYEQGELADLTSHLASRAGQHNVFEQDTIIGGVYPNTESSPAILVDDAPERGPELKATYDEFVDFMNANEEYQQYAQKGVSALKDSYARTLLMQFVRTKLPLDKEKSLDTSKGKWTLQHFLHEQKGTPTAQTLLLGYLLEQLQRNKVLPVETFQVKRTNSEKGGHAYIQTDKQSIIFDPSVLDEPVVGGRDGEFSHPSYS